MTRAVKPMSPTTSSATSLVVVKGAGGWRVQGDGAAGSSAVFRTQADATEAAKAALRQTGGELRIRGRDGRWRETFTLGRQGMARIAAVEGIRLTADMRRTLCANWMWTPSPSRPPRFSPI